MKCNQNISFSIFTLGCKVNQYESQKIAKELLELGFHMEKEEGDIQIINACAVTARADRKTRQLVYRALNEGKYLILTGCLSPDVLAKFQGRKGIIIIPQEQKMEIPLFLAKKFIAKPSSDADDEELTRKAIGRKRAFVAIQVGCDNFCSYCIVPFLRGKPRSRELTEVLGEIKQLIDYGFKEIVLCGIRLGKYGADLADNITLASLLKEILKWEGDFRIRLSSIEPMDFEEELISLISHPKLCPHFHIPLQSGSDKILKAMKRSYTVSDYLSLVRRIKMTVPLVNITTDIIVGFPGETDEDFALTLKVCREAGFGKIHIFPFSARPLTEAGKLQQLPEEIKKERVKALQELGEELSISFRKQLLGQFIWVLVQGKKGEMWEGISHNYVRAYIPGEEPPADMTWCCVKGLYKEGVIVNLKEGGRENGTLCVLYDSKGRS
ncbi:tRNA (N(6)-L-threonylcarbamoyladenosine(37)-C(2))-methylthiotransferase MtaB [bacterium]|nr:tRNA (N(6)-L-threonylcarbamoyladenosine(37)-C(2))-methylthiotransferase MtaB [bacterium]